MNRFTYFVRKWRRRWDWYRMSNLHKWIFEGWMDPESCERRDRRKMKWDK